MKRVLVLDANQRSSLAVIRSLGKVSGITLMAADTSETSIGGSSKYCSNYFTHPPIDTTPSNFVSWLEDFVKDKAIDIVFPCTEISSQLLLMHKDRLSDCIIPFASLETVQSLADKGALVEIAQNAGIQVPDSKIYQSANEFDTSKETTFPLVIKPCSSNIWEEDKWISTQVQIAYDADQLIKIMATTPWLQNSPFIVQEYVEGHGEGIFSIYNQGNPLAFFAHRRLREKPPQGGVSVLCESAELQPNLLENAQKLLDHAKWHGVAMVEFRVAPDGTPYLMEVNTRFWGSLQLAIDAGVDFPRMLYDITIGEEVTPIERYKIGTRMRWFLGDFDRLYLVLRSNHYRFKEKFMAIVDFIIPRPWSTKHQVNRLGDLGPGMTELKSYWKDLFRKR